MLGRGIASYNSESLVEAGVIVAGFAKVLVPDVKPVHSPAEHAVPLALTYCAVITLAFSPSRPLHQVWKVLISVATAAEVRPTISTNSPTQFIILVAEVYLLI